MTSLVAWVHDVFMAQNKAKTPAQKNRRKSVRFSAEEGTLGTVLNDLDGERLKIPLPFLVVDEAYKGCSFASLVHPIWQKGNRVKLKVGRLSPLWAEVRWVRTFDKKIQYVGVEYLE